MAIFSLELILPLLTEELRFKKQEFILGFSLLFLNEFK